MRIYLFLIYVSFLFCSLAYGANQSNAPLEIRTEDGTVDTWPYQLRVSNSALTDNGDGTVSLSTSGGTGSQWGTLGSNIYFNTGNVGIGSSIPSQKLDVSGTVNATAYLGSGASLTGVTKPADIASFITGVTPDYPLSGSGTSGSHLTVDLSAYPQLSGANFTGNLGIGSATPSQKLDVGGTVKATSFIGDGSQLSGLASGITGLTPGKLPKALTASTLGDSLIYSDGTNVGIGTTVPQQKLEIIGTVKATAILTTNIASVGSLVGIGSTNPTSAKLVLVGNGTTSATNSLMIRDSLLNAKVTITDAGNVGIGTSAPSAIFDAVGGTTTLFMGVNVGVGTSTPGAKLVVIGGNVGVGTTVPLSTVEIVGSGATSATSSVHVRDSALASKFIVLDNGNVGVGSSVPRQKVEVTGSVIVSANVGIGNTAPTQALVVTGAGTFSTNVGIGTTAVGSRLTVYGGNVGIGTTAPSQALDVIGTVKATAFYSGNVGIGTSGSTACVCLRYEGGICTSGSCT